MSRGKMIAQHCKSLPGVVKAFSPYKSPSGWTSENMACVHIDKKKSTSTLRHLTDGGYIALHDHELDKSSAQYCVYKPMEVLRVRQKAKSNETKGPTGKEPDRKRVRARTFSRK